MKTARTDGWESRMAERAAERARRADGELSTAEQVAFDAAKQRPWLHGWRRDDIRSIWYGTGIHCICCGRCFGVVCTVYDPDVEYPPEPDWPFTPADCPICAYIERPRPMPPPNRRLQ